MKLTNEKTSEREEGWIVEQLEEDRLAFYWTNPQGETHGALYVNGHDVNEGKYRGWFRNMTPEDAARFVFKRYKQDHALR